MLKIFIHEFDVSHAGSHTFHIMGTTLMYHFPTPKLCGPGQGI